MFNTNRKLVRFLSQIFQITFSEKSHSLKIDIRGKTKDERLEIFVYILAMIPYIIKMTRPVNIAIAVITLAIGYFLLGELPGLAECKNCVGIVTFILQSLGFAFAIGFANIQNDILDLESDKLNRPERPLPSGKITTKTAKYAWIIMLILTIVCGICDKWATNPQHEKLPTTLLFFIALDILLIAYNKKLKHIPLLKNMTVAFLCATPLLLNIITPPASCGFNFCGIGNCVCNFLYLDGFTSDALWTKLGLIYPAILFAFFLTTAREIYKDLEDETGDLKAGIMTFPLIAGAQTARRLAGAIILFTWILLPLPVVQGFYSPVFLIATLATLTPCFVVILVSAHKKNYHQAQSVTKLSMFFGLIALVVSSAL